MANKQLPEFLTAENELDGQEPVYIAQSGKTRKTTLQKIKEFIIGTNALLTTDKTPIGAINELKGIADSNTSQLNENTQDITTHKNALVTESGGIHGLKIESGVWTPILIGETTSGTNTYTKQIGSYYKIGNLVHCEFWIETSDVDSNMSGTLIIAGLPFSVKNTYIPGASIGNLGIGKSFSDIYQISLIGVCNTLSFRCHKAIDGSVFALTPSFVGKVFKISASIDYQI